MLHYRDGYTLAETAKIPIGSTTSAVGVHLHRARTRLRDLLGDDDDSDLRERFDVAEREIGAPDVWAEVERRAGSPAVDAR